MVKGHLVHKGGTWHKQFHIQLVWHDIELLTLISSQFSLQIFCPSRSPHANTQPKLQPHHPNKGNKHITASTGGRKFHESNASQSPSEQTLPPQPRSPCHKHNRPLYNQKQEVPHPCKQLGHQPLHMSVKLSPEHVLLCKTTVWPQEADW